MSLSPSVVGDCTRTIVLGVDVSCSSPSTVLVCDPHVITTPFESVSFLCLGLPVGLT